MSCPSLGFFRHQKRYHVHYLLRFLLPFFSPFYRNFLQGKYPVLIVLIRFLIRKNSWL